MRRGRKASGDETSMKVRVFLRRPDVPGFCPSIAAVSRVETARGSLGAILCTLAKMVEQVTSLSTGLGGS